MHSPVQRTPGDGLIQTSALEWPLPGKAFERSESLKNCIYKTQATQHYQSRQPNPEVSKPRVTVWSRRLVQSHNRRYEVATGGTCQNDGTRRSSERPGAVKSIVREVGHLRQQDAISNFGSVGVLFGGT